MAQGYGARVRSLHYDAAPPIELSHAGVHVAVCPPQDQRLVAVPVPEPTALWVDRVCSIHFDLGVAVVHDNDTPGIQDLESIGNVPVDLLTLVQTVDENQIEALVAGLEEAVRGASESASCLRIYSHLVRAMHVSEVCIALASYLKVFREVVPIDEIVEEVRPAGAIPDGILVAHFPDPRPSFWRCKRTVSGTSPYHCGIPTGTLGETSCSGELCKTKGLGQTLFLFP